MHDVTGGTTGTGGWRGLLGRVHRVEWALAAVAVVVLAGLVVAEPDILQAPFENERTVLFTVGGTVLAAVALVAMLAVRAPVLVRVLVLGVPFVVVNYWLLSPFFVDDVVDDRFVTSIADAQAAGGGQAPAPSTPPPSSAADPAPTTTTAPAGPVLLGSGTFVGLAGHDGRGDAGIFRLPDGGVVLRFENFDIDNGPDLRLYLVPGTDRRSPTGDSHSFGKLRGNVGDQTYEVPAGFPVTPGPWTVLVWCEAFDVEFVAANVVVA